MVSDITLAHSGQPAVNMQTDSLVLRGRNGLSRLSHTPAAISKVGPCTRVKTQSIEEMLRCSEAGRCVSVV